MVMFPGSSVEWILSNTQNQWIFRGKAVGQGERAHAASTADGRKQFGWRKAVTVYSWRRWTGWTEKWLWRMYRWVRSMRLLPAGSAGTNIAPNHTERTLCVCVVKWRRCKENSCSTDDEYYSFTLEYRNFLVWFYYFLDHLRPSHLCLDSSIAYTHAHNCYLTIHYLWVRTMYSTYQKA